jgi:antirestriction protein ArdC
MRRKSHVQFLGGGRRRKALLLPDYIAGWLKKLRDDRKLLIHAAAQPQHAADYILGRRESCT